MKIGRARPDTVQRMVCVSLSLVEAVEAPGIARIKKVLGGREILGVGSPPPRSVPIRRAARPCQAGGSGAYRSCSPPAPRLSHGSRRNSARRDLNLRSPCRVDPVGRRKRRGRQIPHPFSIAIDAPVDRDGRDTGPQRGAEVALRDGIIVAVPMKIHALARTLPPDRRIVRRSVERRAVDILLLHREVELNGFVRIERVDAARTPGLLAGDKGEPLAEVQESALHAREDDVPVDQPLEDIEVSADRVAVDRLNQPVGVKAGVLAGIEQEGNKSLKLQIVGRCAGNPVCASPPGDRCPRGRPSSSARHAPPRNTRRETPIG